MPDACDLAGCRRRCPTSPSTHCRRRRQVGRMNCEDELRRSLTVNPCADQSPCWTGAQSVVQVMRSRAQLPALSDIISRAKASMIRFNSRDGMPLHMGTLVAGAMYNCCNHRASSMNTCPSWSGSPTAQLEHATRSTTPRTCRTARRARVDTGVSQTLCCSQAVTRGCIQRRYHDVARPVALSCAMQRGHSPISWGRLRRHCGGAIATMSSAG